MKVILLEEVPGLGKAGDVKNVADGYARNYLLPRNMVTAATASALSNLQDRVALENRRREKLLSDLQTLTDRLNSVSLKFAVRVGKDNQLYGSVTNQDIADALREQEKIIVDRRSITLRESIRRLGEYKVPVRLGNNYEPQLTVVIVQEDSAK